MLFYLCTKRQQLAAAVYDPATGQRRTFNTISLPVNEIAQSDALIIISDESEEEALKGAEEAVVELRKLGFKGDPFIPNWKAQKGEHYVQIQKVPGRVGKEAFVAALAAINPAK